MAMARVLLERGADPNAVSRMGHVPLADAVRNNRIEFVKLLLEFGVSKFSGFVDQHRLDQCYVSGCGSFYYQAKIVIKTMTPTALWRLFDFLSLKNYVNGPSKSTGNKQKNLFKKLAFCWHLEGQ
jgi:ankyrin repeat protein